MTCAAFLEQLKTEYTFVRVLSDKNESLTALFRHNTLGRFLVVRRYPAPVAVYDYLKTVSHPALPTVFDTYRFEDGQVVLEDYIDGITVADVLENGTYTYGGAKTVLFAIGEALSALHQNGFVHRDVKPENVMISKDGGVKLIDFNASRKVSPLAQTDTVQIGTIGYAAPEQLGLSQSDPRTDVYALGVLLNVMLTGKHPSQQLARGKAGKIVLKATQIDPLSRYASAESFLAAL